MLVLRIEIDTDSFLNHACEQEGTVEELRQYVTQELRRKIEKMSVQIAGIMMTSPQKAILADVLTDPYIDCKDRKENDNDTL